MKVIAIDFDGCICENKWPEIGEPHWNVINRAIAEQKAGAGLILWTCREGELLENALEACERWGLHFDTANESHPEWLKSYTSDPRKIGASEYWDDRAVLMDAENHIVRGYAHWVKNDSGQLCCSHCGKVGHSFEWIGETAFCGYCGYKMSEVN